MSLDRSNMESIDRPNFYLLKVFFIVVRMRKKMAKSRVSLKHPGQIVTSECGISSAFQGCARLMSRESILTRL